MSATAKPAPAPEKVAPVEPVSAKVPVPGGSVDDPSDSWWDRSMGPVGVILTAVVACGLSYLAFKLFN